MIAVASQEKDYYLPAQLLNYDNQLTPGVEGGKRTPNTGGAYPQKNSLRRLPADSKNHTTRLW